MPAAGRKLAFVLASSNHGTMIVNRFDQHMIGPDVGYGVGFQILNTGAFDPGEVDLAIQLLRLRRKNHGDGVVALDLGANIGVHTVEWAKEMTGWGSVLAVEAQERVFYALAGNVAINNCFNAIVLNAAISSKAGNMKIPVPDYTQAASFGSLELRKSDRNEFIGQKIDYDSAVDVRTLAIDDFGLTRVDFLKIDVEGMEMEALDGARTVLAIHRPIMLIEKIKTDAVALQKRLEEAGYVVMNADINVLAIHRDDKTLADLQPKR